jgi:hypothetical protein
MGREQPPGLERVPTPARPGGLLTPRCPCRNLLRVLAAICAPNARVLSCAKAPQIHCETRCNSHRTAWRSFSLETGHHDGQDRAVLGVVKALAALDPAGGGLDDASAQLEGRTYVMAKGSSSSFLHFGVDRSGGQSYREDLVGAIAHPSAVPPDAERCKRTLSEQGYQRLQQSIDLIAHISCDQRVRLQVTRSGVGVTPHPRSSSSARPPQVGAHRAHSNASRTSATSSKGCPWSTSNMRIRGRSRSRSRAVGSCSARTRNR